MRVVVVDPSRTVLKAVSRLLGGDGHETHAFIDGEEALEFIKCDLSVRVLITSAELPSMSGLELCWETRLLSGHGRAIYIILMSSNADQRHLVEALDGGADDFISKPPAALELYARLRSAERALHLQADLIRLATTDPLTGALNRRAFFQQAQQSCKEATVSNRPIAIMFDVDHFKRVNDTYGHDVGDQVLSSISRAVAAECTVLGRLGGEEFAILLQSSNLSTGVGLAERLRAKVAGLSVQTHQGPPTTCSFGVGEWEQGESIDQLLKRADRALYEAKESGRNRVLAARPAVSVTELAEWSGLVRSRGSGA
jgi:two-component system cell cycle response regulator